jgi:type I site-specific restriction-modification system R (restriction) subunit
MATEKQIAANRRNSQISTGPKTREGKFKSSLNALRHGAYSETHILTTEDPGIFKNLAQEILDELQPQTPTELELVDQLIQTVWRRRRITSLIQMRLNQAIEEVITEQSQIQPAEDRPTPTQITVLAMEKLENLKPSFARQEAMELRLMALFQRTLNRLEHVRKIANKAKLEQNPLMQVA